MDQAELEITTSDEGVSCFVSVGLAPLSLGSLVATQLVKAIHERPPGVILHINENVGGVISEMIMAGKMDIALIYNPGGMPGVSFDPVQTEELHFVSAAPPGKSRPRDHAGRGRGASVDIAQPDPYHQTGDRHRPFAGHGSRP